MYICGDLKIFESWTLRVWSNGRDYSILKHSNDRILEWNVYGATLNIKASHPALRGTRKLAIEDLFGCGHGLKVLLTVETHPRPPHDEKPQKKFFFWVMLYNSNVFWAFILYNFFYHLVLSLSGFGISTNSNDITINLNSWF